LGLTRFAIHRIREGTRSRKAIPASPLAKLNGVSGVYRDNWLAPRVSMQHQSGKRTLILAGQAARDCTLRIKSGSRVILQQAIMENEPVRIEFPDVGKPINLVFDRFIELSGRKLAFQIHHTNCFSEADI
jgi:hypothetical protein